MRAVGIFFVAMISILGALGVPPQWIIVAVLAIPILFVASLFGGDSFHNSDGSPKL
jgi:hypothetical protein